MLDLFSFLDSLNVGMSKKGDDNEEDSSVWIQRNFPDIINTINPLEDALDADYLPADMIPSDDNEE
jgi:hypothetical protein